ncbi:hypothetical protein [Psychrobacter sp. I-STPA10]|uniref:hypothetical protein n=1 Tax=Psychrobacter sp. I-STPA10 TaxID=2585769 RepID=UPI001E46A043|nr:hypothetical protein [Psychrobacter sp. I-STPA10]
MTHPSSTNVSTNNLETIATDENLVNEGLTPSQPQNIDDARIDEVLVEDNLDDKDYPTIRDIADEDAVEHSFGKEL